MNESNAIKEMSNWLESPMELNEKPKTISIKDYRKLYWPSRQIEDAYLVEFTDSEDSRYIGFTGPITWTFFGIDFEQLSDEELYNLYTGWFICFFSAQQEDQAIEGQEEFKTQIRNYLVENGYESIVFRQTVIMGGQMYYEIKASKSGNESFVVGVGGELTEYDGKVILPLYKFVGEMWNPLDLDK